MDNNTCLYHLTDKSRLDSILQDGLIPRVGTNSASCGDGTPAIYLSPRDSLADWALILGSDACVEVKWDAARCFRMETYGGSTCEYIVFSRISPEYITECPVPEITPCIRNRLLRRYVRYNLSHLCSQTARWLDGPSNEEWQAMLQHSAANYLAILKCIGTADMLQADWDALAQGIEHDGRDGEYTLCDHYFMNKGRLWQQLHKLGTPEAEELENWVGTSLQQVAYLQTGGYCT